MPYLHLLGGLLLLLLLSISLIFLSRSSLLNWWWGWLLLHLLLDGNKESNDLLGLDHVVLIDLELSEDVVDLSLGHLDHVVVGAGTADLSQERVQLGLSHEDTDVVEGSAEIIFVQGTVLVDVHQLEAVLVHLELLLGETTFILALAHLAGLCEL